MTAFRLWGLVACGGLLGLSGAIAQDRPPAEAGRINAAKLAGLAGFVNLECPTLRSDPARLRQAVEAMGGDVAALETGELLMAAGSYIEAYRRDVPASCRGAEERFGPSGSLIPAPSFRRRLETAEATLRALTDRVSAMPS